MSISWQPIETAPKDGSIILLWPPIYDGTVCSGRWVQPYRRQPCWSRFGGSRACDRATPPTHWAPLPDGHKGP